MRSSAEVRRPLGKGQLCDFRRISELPSAWGEDLDRLGATYYQVRWVAGPGPRKALLEVEWRYRALVRHLRRGEMGWRAFREMVKAFEAERRIASGDVHYVVMDPCGAVAKRGAADPVPLAVARGLK